MAKQSQSAATMLEELSGNLEGAAVARLAMPSRQLAHAAIAGLSVHGLYDNRRIAYAVALAPVVFKHARNEPGPLQTVLLAALRAKKPSMVEQARKSLLRADYPRMIWKLCFTASQLPTAEALQLLAVAIDRKDLSKDSDQEQGVYRAFLERVAGAKPSERPKASDIKRCRARAEARAIQLPEIWLGLARWACVSGDREGALSALESAADRGVLPKLKDLQKDKSFARIRRDPRFLALGQSAKPFPFGKGGVRGIPLVERCITFLEKCPRPKPAYGASEAALRGKELAPGVALPPTLHRFLQYDFALASLPTPGRNVWKNIGGFGRNPKAPVFKSVAMEEVARGALEAASGLPIKQLNVSTDDWSRIRKVCEPLKGKLFALPYMGDQQHYLYAGGPDRDGELPILGVEVEASFDQKRLELVDFAIWIKYPGFDLFLADMIELIEDPTGHREFKALCQRHRRKNPEL
jgi:hypothetical protein